MTVNKILSFVVLFMFVLSSNFIMCMEKEKTIKKGKTLIGVQEGAPDAKPFAIISMEALQNNKVFQRLQKALQSIVQKDDMDLSSVIYSSLPEKLDFIKYVETTIIESESTQKEEAKEEAQEVGKFLSSLLMPKNNTGSSESEEEMADIKELFASLNNGQKATETETTTSPDNQTAPSELSWALWYQNKFFGAAAAMQYAVANNQFDKDNTSHVALLYSALSEHSTTNDSLNTTYTQQCIHFKKNQCLAMAALLKTAETQLSQLELNLKTITESQVAQKEAILKGHNDEYVKNNTAYQTILPLNTPGNIVPNTLEISEEFHTALLGINETFERIGKLSASVDRCKTVTNDFLAQFAIENKK